jgi:hypothetical protein
MFKITTRTARRIAALAAGPVAALAGIAALGLGSAPVASAATCTSNCSVGQTTTESLDIGTAITLTGAPATFAYTTPVALPGFTNVAAITLTVTSNDPSGYTLTEQAGTLTDATGDVIRSDATGACQGSTATCAQPSGPPSNGFHAPWFQMGTVQQVGANAGLSGAGHDGSPDTFQVNNAILVPNTAAGHYTGVLTFTATAN